MAEGTARRGCASFVAFLAACLVAVATLNFVVDPYDLYPPDTLPPITFASHRESSLLLARTAVAPRIIVLGTSRVGKIEPAYVEASFGAAAFNANLNEATTEALLAYYLYVVETLPRPPAILILGLDTRSFSNASELDQQLINTEALARQVPGYVGRRDRLAVWLRLLNMYQLEGSVRSLRMALRGDYPQPTFRFAADGRRVCRAESPAATGPAVVARVLPEISALHTGFYRDFTALSAERLAAFEQVVASCARTGTELIVFTTPVHPSLREALELSPNYAARQGELREYLDASSGAAGFTFVDLSDVLAYGGDPDDWLDPLHHGEATGRLIVDQLVAARRR